MNEGLQGSDMEVDRSDLLQQLLGTRRLDPQLPQLLQEHLEQLEATGLEATHAGNIINLVANAISASWEESSCPELDRQAAVQVCVQLAGSMVAWLSRGAAGCMGAVAAAPATCGHLQAFFGAALDLASQVFLSREWYEDLGPERYVAAGNAARCYVRDLAPVALDATAACWAAVGQHVASGAGAAPGAGGGDGAATLSACRALFDTVFEGLRTMGTASADRINDPSVPREMRSFAGINILWNGLSRLMTALPPDAVQQLLRGSAVQSVLRSLLGYMGAEVHALALGPHSEYDTHLKVARFWLQHAGRVGQAHPTAAAGCWQQIAAAAAETYGHIAGTGLAAARLPSQQPAGTDSQQGPGQQQRQSQLARDLDSFVASKLAGLLAVGLDQPAEQRQGLAGDQPHQAHASMADIEARIAYLLSLAGPAPTTHAGGVVWAADQPATAGSGVPGTALGVALAGLALLQRASSVGPEARAALAGQLLPWAACRAAVHGMELVASCPAALLSAAPCLDLPHTLAAGPLALLAACGEAQAGQDADTFVAVCATLCNWGASAHPLLSQAAADSLGTLVQRSQPQLAARLVAAVARMTAMAARAVAAAGAGAALAGPAEGAGGCGAGVAAGMCGAGTWSDVSVRLARLLGSMLAAAAPNPAAVAAASCPAVEEPQPSAMGGAGEDDASGSLDLSGAAAARALWGAAAAAAAAASAATTADGGAPHPPAGIVSEQKLAARTKRLLAAVRQAQAVLSAAAAQPAGGGGGSAASAAAASAAASSLARHWLVQLLGGLEVTVAHALTLQREQPSGGGGGSPVPLAEVAALAASLVVQQAGAGKDATAQAPCSVPPLAPHPGAPPVAVPGSGLAVAHAALKLLARTFSFLPAAPQGAATAGAGSGAPAAPPPAVLLSAAGRLAECGAVGVVADVAAVAVAVSGAATAAGAHESALQALWHPLLRHPHWSVAHAAMQSYVTLLRTAPQSYDPRALVPPETYGSVTGMLKSYLQRTLPLEEVAAAAAAAATPGGGGAGKGGVLAEAAVASCEAQEPLGRPAAPAAARRAVQQGMGALQAALEAMLAARCQDNDGEQWQQLQPQLVPPSGPVVAPAPSAPSAAGGGGPLSGLIADDNAAVGGLAAALGSLERSLGALGAAVRASRMGGGPCSRPADWDQLQAHARAMLGDLSSATSRLRNMQEMLHGLKG